MLVGWVCLVFFSPLLEPPLHAWVNRGKKEAFTVILRTKIKKTAGSYLLQKENFLLLLISVCRILHGALRCCAAEFNTSCKLVMQPGS
jgi:hypothetical protein